MSIRVPNPGECSLKPDVWANNPLHRLKDKADVMELFHARQLPHELNVADPSVSTETHNENRWAGGAEALP